MASRRLRCCRFFFLVVTAAIEGRALASPEVDPFAAEYAPPRATELGTAAQQVRILGSGGGVIERGVGLAGQGTIELMTLAWIGVRGSGLVTLPITGSPQLFAARLGPSLHLLPYHRVDIGTFFEGGASLVDITTKKHAWMPVLTGGGTVDVALTDFFVIHLEGYLEAGIADRGGAADVHLHPIGLLGFGLLL